MGTVVWHSRATYPCDASWNVMAITKGMTQEAWLNETAKLSRMATPSAPSHELPAPVVRARTRGTGTEDQGSTSQNAIPGFLGFGGV